MPCVRVSFVVFQISTPISPSCPLFCVGIISTATAPHTWFQKPSSGTFYCHPKVRTHHSTERKGHVVYYASLFAAVTVYYITRMERWMELPIAHILQYRFGRVYT